MDLALFTPYFLWALGAILAIGIAVWGWHCKILHQLYTTVYRNDKRLSVIETEIKWVKKFLMYGDK